MFEAPIQPQEVEREINAIRLNPRILVPRLEKELAKFQGKRLKLTPNYSTTTVEGAPLWKQTIEFLRKQMPLEPLTLHRGLCRSAQEHVVDLASHDMMGNVGSNGSRMGERIRKYNEFTQGLIGQMVAEELPFKNRDHVRETLMALILDDGVPNRSHRSSIFSKEFKYFGCASCRSSTYILTVIDLASQNLNPIEGVQPPENRSKYSDMEDTYMPGDKGVPLVVRNPEQSKRYDAKQQPVTKYPHKPSNNQKLIIVPEQIEEHLNAVRTDPQSFIAYLEKQLLLFDETGTTIHYAQVKHKVVEGRKAWIEAIEFLKTQEPLNPLTLHEGLCKCAQSHAVDLSRNNMNGHTGSNGKNLTHRITRFNRWEQHEGGPGGATAEIVSNSVFDKDMDPALELLACMVINDGVASKIDRKEIFNPQYRYFGSASCLCDGAVVKTVLNFAQNDLIPIEGVQPAENLGEYTGKEGNPTKVAKPGPTKPGVTKPAVTKPSQPVIKAPISSKSSMPLIKPPPKTVVTTTGPALKPEVAKPAAQKTLPSKPSALKPVASQPVLKTVTGLKTPLTKTTKPDKK